MTKTSQPLHKYWSGPTKGHVRDMSETRPRHASVAPVLGPDRPNSAPGPTRPRRRHACRPPRSAAAPPISGREPRLFPGVAARERAGGQGGARGAAGARGQGGGGGGGSGGVRAGACAAAAARAVAVAAVEEEAEAGEEAARAEVAVAEVALRGRGRLRSRDGRHANHDRVPQRVGLRLLLRPSRLPKPRLLLRASRLPKPRLLSQPAIAQTRRPASSAKTRAARTMPTAKAGDAPTRCTASASSAAARAGCTGGCSSAVPCGGARRSSAYGTCRGHVVDVSWTCRRLGLDERLWDMSRTCRGHVPPLAVARDAAGPVTPSGHAASGSPEGEMRGGDEGDEGPRGAERSREEPRGAESGREQPRGAERKRGEPRGAERKRGEPRGAERVELSARAPIGFAIATPTGRPPLLAERAAIAIASL